jgi:predicted ATPase
MRGEKNERPVHRGWAIGGTVQSILGHPDQGMRLNEQAQALARRLQHFPSLAQALALTCEMRKALDDAAEVTRAATELLAISDEHNLSQFRATALIFLGWAGAHSDELTPAIALLKEGIASWTQMGMRILVERSLCLLAEGYLRAQCYSEGREQIAAALAIAAETGEQWYLAPLYQVKAELQ